MEWRQQTSVSCADAFNEAQRWIEEVTGKSFGCNDFRAALENGVLLCDLINQLKPGIIKRVNRLSTPIAGLDNVNVFLKACGKLGLNVSQLFHPGDLQDLSTRATVRRDESNRRLKNVLITIYWLGRKAHLDAFYSGPQLNFKAFEGLLGLALSKALDEGSNVKECWDPEREECRRIRPSYKMGNSADSIDFLYSRGVLPNNESCGSDAEAEQVFKMEPTQPSTQQNKAYVPPPLLRRKQGREENERGCASPLARAYQMQVRPERPVQVNPGWIWSKSLSDIPMVYPVRKVPDVNTIYDVDQDSEAQWHDDLSKWKNRRRSSKSDLRRKSQDREHVINQMTNGALAKFEKNEAQGGQLKRDQQSPRRHYPAPRPYSTSPSAKSLSSDLRPRTRALLARSYATEAPFSPKAPLSPHDSSYTQGSSVGAMPASDGIVLGEKTHFASLASDGTGVTTPSRDCPFSSQTQVKAQGSPAPFQPRDPTESMLSHKELPFCLDPKVPSFCPGAVNQAGVNALEDLPHQNYKSQEESQKTSWEPAVEQGSVQQAAEVNKYLFRTASWSGSASLPRGYRRSEGSSRLSSAITARPFGTKQSRVSSLPRLCHVDNQGLLLKSEQEESLSPTTKSSLKRQTVTDLKGQQKKANQAKQNVTEQGEKVQGASVSRPTAFQTDGYHHQPYTQTQLLPQPYSNLQTHHNKSLTLPSDASIDLPKVDHSDMRVSLALKPNSRTDFGFETHWDSTGVRVKFIQPGSPAELCQLCVDDEIVTVNGVAVAHMNYNQWKDKMTSSLQTGSLTMDIRRYGNKDWSTSEGSHPNQSGQSRVTLNLTAAAPGLIGCPDHHANSGASTETTVRNLNGQTDNVLQGKIMHGELPDNHRTARNKDHSNISMKNQKRRAEFFKQKGGSESAISDLQVPSLSPSSSSWSWDREEDRRRQEKWQEEQERLLQKQYQRDQERLESEWQRAQQDAKGELCRKPGAKQNTFEMTNGVESPASTQLHVTGLKNKTREEQIPDRDKLKVAGSNPQSNASGEQHDKISGQVWAEDSFGFAQLSPAHRAKSLSTPALDGPYKQTRGDERKGKGQSVCKAEKDRQQILEEMKKRTQLLTDNSWIRQRSSSFYKEPIYVGVPMKRFDSLDDLDTLRQTPLSTTTFSYPRPHSAAAGYCTPSRNSSSRYSTGSLLSQRHAFVDFSHHGSPRMVCGRRTCCVCERVLGSGAAMVIEALGLCFHLACFQCVGCHRHLGGTETGVQVRIRNRKPYCEPCYFQLKSGAPSM
ncbi:LIM domain only protein 7-like isoform X1 [Sander lucioperca]|uniref:LIM domain only protein 7-like isoform X1 n=1 Tax=Sander lucioperca TaxID=283035 RepID=UPI001653DEF4|nr:LIM domain only protein 7-like isoform X1 [Sander lucioperca]XP_035855376.1 LIM domain only protein 7-like isoform X1 [Sander lucioperca]